VTLDDDADCVEHVWVLTELHLSIRHGGDMAERCERCDAIRYAQDPVRTDPRRPPLPPTRRLRGE
jgi:hypothetical protein